MIISGIDPGSNATGYSFIKINKGQVKVLEYGVIRAKPKESLILKLERIHRNILELFMQYKPSHLALETAFVAKYPSAALVLGHTRGAIMVAAQFNKIELFEYEPRLVKKAATGVGNASKTQIQNMVKEHFSLKQVPKPHDSADALAVAYCHILHERLLVS